MRKMAEELRKEAAREEAELNKKAELSIEVLRALTILQSKVIR
jgi:hypothetical protein